MASMYSTTAMVSFILAGLFFMTAILLWFILKIGKVIGTLSGHTARKAIRQMKNQKTPRIPSGNSLEQKLGAQKIPSPIPRTSGYPETSLLNKPDNADFQKQTQLLHTDHAKETEILAAATEILLEAGANSTAHIEKPLQSDFHIVEEITTVHTSEVIQ